MPLLAARSPPEAVEETIVVESLLALESKATFEGDVTVNNVDMGATGVDEMVGVNHTETRVLVDAVARVSVVEVYGKLDSLLL